MFRRNVRRMLGLALEERAITVADARASGGGGGPSIAKQARFELPASASWDRPAELGAALAAFLREQGVATGRAIVGLPARWVMARAQSLPPTAPEAVPALLRLAAERAYPGDAAEWALDFAGSPSATERSSALLLATPRERLNRVVAVMTAAGLRVDRVIPTAMALASAHLPGRVDSTSAPGRALLRLDADGAELAVSHGGQMIALERLGAGPDLAALEGEVRRALAAAGGGVETIELWSDGVEASAVGRRLLEGLGVAVRAAPQGLSAAAALGASGLARPAVGSVDFLHSRLEVASPRRLTVMRLAPIVGAAALLMWIAWLAIDRTMQQAAVQRLQAELGAIKTQVESARDGVQRTTLARGWLDRRPPMLDCLRSLTLAFPGSGAVWATSLSLRDDLTGTLAGKARSERSVTELIDRMRASKRFVEVWPVYLRQVDRGGQSVSFAVTFVFVGQE